MTLILAFLTGLGLGYIIERGDLCFHSTLRGLFQWPRQLDLFRAYLLAVLVAGPLVYGLTALGLIHPWVPPFAWPANVSGGLIFGVGMVIASSCVTGLFYKLGHGMLGTLVGLATWAVGDIAVYRGPLSSLREALQSSPIMVNGQSATVLNLLGPAGIFGVGLAWLLAAIWLWRSARTGRGHYWGWGRLGLAVGLFMGLAWLLAQAGGSNYTFGTSGVPSGVLAALSEGNRNGSAWIPVTLVSIVPGAFLAAVTAGTLWVRGETARRYAELAVGGLLMGVGAGLAGGCNLGHSLVGVPLLSLGSLTTTVSMALGVWLADRAVKLWGAAPPRPLAAESVE
ncbi:MAG: YeeE/YedE family protein [Chloroflexi bacterium]|nr:YeeE/YedE family protein [Chloroflexota bacterium]